MATLLNGCLTTTVLGSTPVVTTYTSGSGTYTPRSVGSLVRVTLVGGGGGGVGGGTGAAAGGGGAGCTKVVEMRLFGPVSYTVGSGGAGGAPGVSVQGSPGSLGNPTYFHTTTAPPGNGGSSGTSGMGGVWNTSTGVGGWLYEAGGAGADTETLPGNAAGWSTRGTGLSGIGAFSGMTDGGKSGGDSTYGIGGKGGNPHPSVTAGSSGSGYGSGGGGGGSLRGNAGTAGAGGAGAGGLIIVEDFGV